MEVNEEKSENMADRLSQFLNEKNISKSEFADSLGIGRSNITHIFTGRNGVSDKVLIKILSVYPEINPLWLVSGNGNMLQEKPVQTNEYAVNVEPEDAPLLSTGGAETASSINFPVDEPADEPIVINDKAAETHIDTIGKQPMISAPGFNTAPQPVYEHQISQAKSTEKKIRKIVFFYTDKTFAEYYPESE